MANNYRPTRIENPFRSELELLTKKLNDVIKNFGNGPGNGAHVVTEAKRRGILVLYQCKDRHEIQWYIERKKLP